MEPLVELSTRVVSYLWVVRELFPEIDAFSEIDSPLRRQQSLRTAVLHRAGQDYSLLRSLGDLTSRHAGESLSGKIWIAPTPEDVAREHTGSWKSRLNDARSETLLNDSETAEFYIAGRRSRRSHAGAAKCHACLGGKDDEGFFGHRS